ncbi:ribosomal protein S30 (nucleomorph) [Bigelowiella natans]|uniref:40S ribosomal protein S30 n=1 Tax=Bigelowiella natans TaxID=227086 RepID=Q3LW43_BIGNA|nr:ribosomal protein S30 [Bigelowiella natans]ABA27322.1 ribosomal protein S30 [Bigelowiella natans]
MGKVHGSLTRAGKVRNQTKFIAKSDKKVKNSGRARYRKKMYKLIKYYRKTKYAII